MNFAKHPFDAYNETQPNPWKTFDGRDVPQWDQLSEQVQKKWKAVAKAAAEACGYSLREIESPHA